MIDSSLIHRCTIQSRSASENSFGEQEYTWSDTSANVECRFSHPSGRMRRLESGEFVESMPKLFVKATETIAETNRVLGTSGFTDTYEVLKVKERYGGAGLHHKECDLRKVI